MAGSANASILAIISAAMVFASLVLVSEAQIDFSPAPTPVPNPTSGSAAVSPAFTAFFMSFAVLVFGSVFRFEI